MKKPFTNLFRLLLTSFLALTLTACDDGDKKSTSTNTNTEETAATADEDNADAADESADNSNDSSGTSSTAARSGAVKILCFGDSITAGVGTTDPYPAKLARITGDPVINTGITSSTSAQGLRRIGGELSRHNPTHVCILYGTNDARTGVSAGAAGSNIGGMIDAVKASGARAIVGTITPLTGSSAGLQSSVNAINSRIKSVAASKGVPVADIAADFGSGRGTMNSDGIHPNNSGAAIIAVNFSEKL